MQTATEITSNLKNLRYYSDKIAELAKQQFQLDYIRGQELGINAGPGSIRFDCLGCIIGSCNWLDVYCDNIAKNLERASKQDKLLYTAEERAQEEEDKERERVKAEDANFFGR